MDDFKIYDKVIDITGEWEGYIDAISPQGKIKVRTPSGYQWVFPFQIRRKNETSNVTRNTDISFF